MKFGKYLASKQKPEWAASYLDYKALKDVIKLAVEEVQSDGILGSSPRETSLTVLRSGRLDRAEDRFFMLIEKEVEKVSRFTQNLVSTIRGSLKRLNARCSRSIDDPVERETLLRETKEVGDQFLTLEKYVNLNYMGFHKILKKHDKMLPHTPCRQFYISHLHQQPWVQGNYSDLIVHLSAIYSKLRCDTEGIKNEDSMQGFVRSTTKYWVKTQDVSAVKHIVLQQLPVFQFDSSVQSTDAQLTNSVYLDNASAELYHGRLDKRPNAIAVRLRWYGSAPPKVVFVERKTHRESWKGEESVKERFCLPEAKVVPFLDGEYTVEAAVEDLRAKGREEAEIEAFTELFTEVAKVVDSKQLRPMLRTQYMRTAFQIPYDATVRVSLDTNLTMIKENPDDGPSCTLAGRWYRDPSLPVGRAEITRFPHAVLEVKLSLAEGDAPPPWVQDLITSGMCTEVHKFSKFIHGTCTLMPDLVQAVPYWVDDESVRASMLASAPLPPTQIEPALSAVNKRRVATAGDDIRHPLLGDAPTLSLIQPLRPPERRKNTGPTLFDRVFGLEAAVRSNTMRMEPKTFFANERTFLSWLHMAVTVGSIAAALLGFAATADKAAGHAGEIASVELICMILLPLAVVICFYALTVFLWRAHAIEHHREGAIDDRRGPLGLAGMVVCALFAIFLLSAKDLVDTMRHQGQGAAFLAAALGLPSPAAP